MDHVLNLHGMRRDTHWTTIEIAAVVVLTVQLDVNAVIDRLSIDDQFRNIVADGWPGNYPRTRPSSPNLRL